MRSWMSAWACFLVFYPIQQKHACICLSEALPNTSERDKGYFLGYAEAKADKTSTNQEREAEKEER